MVSYGLKTTYFQKGVVIKSYYSSYNLIFSEIICKEKYNWPFPLFTCCYKMNTTTP